jgi:lipopolysaccharide cholinephosphotransferase
MKLKLQLERIFKCVEPIFHEYWVDSGTLLGLIRENGMIDGDNDIDISILVTSEPDILLLIDSLRSEFGGIKIRKKSGLIYKIKFFDKNITHDISIFRNLKDNHIYTSQHLFNSKCLSHKFLIIKYFALKILSLPCIDISFLIRLNIVSEGFWLYPKDLVLLLEYIPKTNIKIPKNYESYLTFRYGDWRTPRSDWKTSIHDAALLDFNS